MILRGGDGGGEGSGGEGSSGGGGNGKAYPNCGSGRHQIDASALGWRVGLIHQPPRTLVPSHRDLLMAIWRLLYRTRRHDHTLKARHRRVCMLAHIGNRRSHPVKYPGIRFAWGAGGDYQRQLVGGKRHGS